ncbi:hypothetical protein A4G19_10660 [Pasteurellaceae bacterium Macca]|nr:hypothetical protein [Pasteurellaceae bacterium Macca]
MEALIGVEISKNGIRKSATFKTKSEANAWAVDEERKIESLAKVLLLMFFFVMLLSAIKMKYR